MKMLQVIGSYVHSQRSGGPVRIMFDYAKHLVKLGYSVNVLTTKYIDSGKQINFRKEILEGVNIRYYPFWSESLYCFSPNLYYAAWKEIQHYDYVHICETRGALPIWIKYLAGKYNIPLIHSAFGMLPRKGRNFLRVFYDEIFAVKLIKASALLLAQTNHEAEEYLKLGAVPEKIRLLPLGVGPIPQNMVKGEFRKRFNIPPEAMLLLFLGRIHRLKGLERLLRVLYKASLAFEKLHLAIVGVDDGALLETINYTKYLGIYNKVTFPGPLYGEERFSAYLDADLFIITPIHYEETSLASIEAMGCGTPVLVSKEASIPYLDEYGGGICKEFTERDFVKIISELCKNPYNLKFLGNNAKKLVTEKLNIECIVKQLDYFIKEDRNKRQGISGKEV